MKPILYFQSDCTLTVNLDGAKGMGLDYAFAGSVCSRELNANSPSGRAGVMFVEAGRMNEGESPEYDPKKQTWIEMPQRPGRKPLWVGFWNDRKPGPSDLVRPRTLNSMWVDLLDGNRWLIPVVCDYDDSSKGYVSALPSYISFDAQGKPKRGATVAAYRRLWDLVAPLASAKLKLALNPTAKVAIADEAMTAAAVELLKANYCVDLPEIALLELLDDEALATVVDASSRYHALLMWLEESAKKKEDASIPSGSDTSGGAAA